MVRWGAMHYVFFSTFVFVINHCCFSLLVSCYRSSVTKWLNHFNLNSIKKERNPCRKLCSQSYSSIMASSRCGRWTPLRRAPIWFCLNTPIKVFLGMVVNYLQVVLLVSKSLWKKRKRNYLIFQLSPTGYSHGHSVNW